MRRKGGTVGMKYIDAVNNFDRTALSSRDANGVRTFLFCEKRNLYQEIQVLWIALFGDSILTIRCLSVISALGIFFLTSHLIYLVSKDSLISLVIPSIYIFYINTKNPFSY